MTVRTLAFVVLTVALTAVGCEGDTGSQDAYLSQSARIYVDGEGTDWESLSMRHADADDGGAVGIERLWMAHTDRHLFLRLELSRALNLQEDNALTLYLDTDNDPTTGKKTLGLGTELAWTFGEREGRFEGTEVEHADIGLTSLPTVQSDVFEIALDRSAVPADSASLFQGDSLRLALSSEGDRLPDDPGGVGYALSDADLSLTAPSLDRPSDAAVRLMSYNAVNNFDRELNSLFIDDRQPSYRRILGAIGPDVIAVQEVYDQSADRVETVAEGELGLADEWNWAKTGRDLVIGSRFSIVDTHTIPGYDDYESGAFLLDTEAVLGSRLIVVNMHPPCCNYGPEDGEPSSNARRQRVVDGVMAFVRALKKGEGPFDVASGTPIAILGDMNFVGDPQQPRTLRTGEIVNTDTFGPAFEPDWDDSDLLDTRPRQTASPMHVTWTDAGSSFPPGRLDYAYVTDSVLDVVHEFVLYTPALPDSTLQRHGLQAGDTDTASDHLPVVVDVQTQ
jgi:endonuclease/exonuclease/phosphatase family metal-dependent hydrolase